MKKRILITALLAGAATTLAAFAPLPVPATAMIAATGDNVTVIHKTNPNWPVPGLMTTAPCTKTTCVEV